MNLGPLSEEKYLLLKDKCFFLGGGAVHNLLLPVFK